tara:strand:- start:599 stop:706 length:108 start_codon:yes stop_codon:yes gene_type:complete
MKEKLIKQIIKIWFETYGENMTKEYPGFIKKLKKL